MGKGGLYEANTWSNLYLHNNVFRGGILWIGARVFASHTNFLSGACMAFALLVHLFSVWIVKFQLNISEIEEGTFEYFFLIMFWKFL